VAQKLNLVCIVSQVEYGLRDKVARDDARLTAVMDCQGTSAIGFPLNMMKSCSVLVQENYPMRLAALFVINLPPIVQVLANAVLQVIFFPLTLVYSVYLILSVELYGSPALKLI
jgi:hypothetical protein